MKLISFLIPIVLIAVPVSALSISSDGAVAHQRDTKGPSHDNPRHDKPTKDEHDRRSKHRWDR